MLRLKHRPTFDSIAAGKKNVCDLPLGLRYHAIHLELGNNDGGPIVDGEVTNPVNNTISSLVEDVVLKINGKPFRTHTGDELNQLNGINGNAFLASASGTNA